MPAISAISASYFQVFNTYKHVLIWWLVEEDLYRRRHSTGSLLSPRD